MTSYTTSDGYQYAYTNKGKLYRAPINSFGLWELCPFTYFSGSGGKMVAKSDSISTPYR